MRHRLLVCLFTATSLLLAMPPDAIVDEAKVPAYTLPDPSTCLDGSKVVDAKIWQEKRRPELLHLFESEIYGRTLLGKPDALRFVVREENKSARGSKATRLRVGVLFEGREDGRQMELLVYLPNEVNQPVPMFVGLNFDGNYTTTDDPDLPVPAHFAMGLFDNKLPDHKPTEKGRGAHAYMWQVDRILEAGCGVATAAYGEIEPDADARWKEGPRGLAAEPKAGDWGAIGAWAWGLSRAMDYLETNARVDASKVAVMGFSRLGKAAVWAGAQDSRFALVISNESGAGGLALSKRIFGETVKDLATRFPHWFTSSYANYASAEDKLPVDQHELAALIAPRPLLAMSGSQDLWSDPHGEFLSLLGADPVYRLLTQKGLESQEWPKDDELSDGLLGYFRHKGGHDVSLEDWRAMISFAAKHLKVSPPPVYAVDRYAMRLAALPKDQQAAWQDYFTRSDAMRRKNDAVLDAELKAAKLTESKEPAHNRKEFELESKTPDSLFTSAEGLELARAIVSFQSPGGGWSKAVDYTKGPRAPGMQFTNQGHSWRYVGTFDNRSTTEQLKFLARSHALHPEAEVKSAVERGVDYMLQAQAPNGGWPQCFPLEGAYHDAITLNDGAMIHVLEVLQLIVAGKDGFDWIDDARRARAKTAIERGTATLLKLQRGIWSPQYDLLSMEVIGARGFELAGVSAGESVEVLRYLMKIKSPSKEMIASIEGGIAWFRDHQLPPGADGKPRWARFNDVRTQQPFFPGKRDGRAHATYEAMDEANPGGYDYFTTKGVDLLGKWSDKWRKGLQ